MKTTNPYAVRDVNAKQGPTTGNTGDVAKRKSFKAAKESMAPVARAITKAYGERAPEDFVSKKLEPIASNVRGKKFS